MKIPFCPLPIERAKVVAKKLYGLTGFLNKTSPGLENLLEQAGLDIDKRDYLGIAMFSAIFMSSIVFLLLFIVTLTIVDVVKGFIISLSVSALIFFVIIQYLKKYPKLLLKKKVASIERNLLYAIRHIYVQVRAGIPLFETFVSISNGSYGAISDEFRDLVKEINAGKPIETALEELTMKNPSVFFRRIVWQLSNGIKAGADVSIVMKSVIDNISAEQRIAIRKYGSQLNPLTLVYMMVAVIMPAMGITFMIVLSTFSGLSISENMFWGILGFLVVFQFMFLGIIKSKRPNLL
ncbi:MAG: type II secretion system F family protein [Candidatus Aenigmarchaeota archaeon]|nr:type II secretion system F family protein [Candidatus Aenigmarchaeota archaeon]